MYLNQFNITDSAGTPRSTKHFLSSGTSQHDLRSWPRECLGSLHLGSSGGLVESLSDGISKLSHMLPARTAQIVPQDERPGALCFLSFL